MKNFRSKLDLKSSKIVFSFLFGVLFAGFFVYATTTIDTDFTNAIQYIQKIILTDNGGSSGTTGIVLNGPSGDIGIDQKLYHIDDENTYIHFEGHDDRIDFITNGTEKLNIFSTRVAVNAYGEAVDFSIEDDNSNTLFKTNAIKSTTAIGTDSDGGKLLISGSTLAETQPARTIGTEELNQQFAALEINNGYGNQTNAIQIGDSSDATYKISIRNGQGRINHTRNAFDGYLNQYHYESAGEGANRFKIGDGQFGFYTATARNTGDTISRNPGLIIDSDGNVGIGSETAAEVLDVNGAISRKGFIALYGVSETLLTTATDLKRTNNLRYDSDYYYFNESSNQEEITFQKDGYYKITVDISTDVTSATTVRSSSKFYLMKYDYLAKSRGTIAGTEAYMYNRMDANGEDSASVTTIMNMSAGDKVKVVGIKIAGTDTIETIPNGCRITIEKI